MARASSVSASYGLSFGGIVDGIIKRQDSTKQTFTNKSFDVSKGWLCIIGNVRLLTQVVAKPWLCMDLRRQVGRAVGGYKHPHRVAELGQASEKTIIIVLIFAVGLSAIREDSTLDVHVSIFFS
jgi:hypothetical protein